MKIKAWNIIPLILVSSLFFGCATLGKDNVSIEGYWDQYMLAGKDYIYGGTFSVEVNNGIYIMQYIKKQNDDAIVTDTYFIVVRNSQGLYDISFRNGTWKFKSDWGSGDIGEFILTMVSKDRFEGWSYLRGERRSYNVWKRVK